MATTGNAPHRHVVNMGIDRGADRPLELLTMEQLRDAMSRGESFTTRSTNPDVLCKIRIVTCDLIGGCRYRTIKPVSLGGFDIDIFDLDECAGMAI